jgi:pimeloyl-ACP methyl ester carboxylesterase
MNDASSSSSFSLWGALEPGPFAVGYRSRVAYDYSRLYDRAWPEAGQRAPKRFRPLLYHCWYPAERPETAQPLTFQEYWNPLPEHVAQASLLSRLVERQRDELAKALFNKRCDRLNEAESEILRRIVASPTHAFRNASPAPGRFPLVMSHGGLGSSYEDNTVLFEYLASWGYAVASAAFQSEDASVPAIDWDLDRSVKDLDRLLNLLHDEPFVDLEKIAVIGQSYGAQAALAYGAEVNSPVDAVVSLDSTVEYAKGDYSGFKPLMDRLEWSNRLTVPALLFARKAMSPDFGPFADRRYTERYYALVEDIGHNDFISSGVACARHEPERPPDRPAPARVQAIYEEVCRLTRQFLDAVLKEDETAQAGLKERVDAGESRPITLTYDPAEPRLPTPKQLIDRVLERGLEAALEWSRHQPAQNAEWGLTETARGLNRLNRPDDAVTIMEHCVTIRPDSATAWNFMGELYAAAGRERQSVDAYRRSLSLLPEEDRRNNWEKWLGSRAQSEIDRMETLEGRDGVIEGTGP